MKESTQGDAVLSKISEKLGVKTKNIDGKIKLTKIEGFSPPTYISLNLKNTPDLAQTIVVTCLGMNVECKLRGLHTLKIKETDRLMALKVEIEKLGAKVKITGASLELVNSGKINTDIAIDTYNDHRMAMAFAPLGILKPIIIESPNVVSKSFPDFWDKIIDIGFKINKV